MTQIVIASKNPVKCNAALYGFQTMFKETFFEIEKISVPSEVSEQPMTGEETLQGAINRAKNAQKESPKADFWIGIEGGIQEENQEMEAFAWVYMIAKNGKTGKGKTGSFYLPKKVVTLIKEGKELGEADDIVFKQRNSKQQGGAVGILTKGVLDRESYYQQAVILALIPFVNDDLY